MKICIALVLLSAGLLFLRYELKPKQIVIVIDVMDQKFLDGKGNK